MEISYKTEGLRILNSMPYIELRPITILVGLNNSGKSTFLRSLQLIKDTINVNRHTPILWQGGANDFGNFSTSLNMKRRGKEEEISFSFRIANMSLQKSAAIYENSLLFSLLLQIYPELSPNIEVKELHCTIAIGRSKDCGANVRDIIKKIEGDAHFGNKNMKFEIHFDSDGSKIDKITINENDISRMLNCNSVHYDSSSIFVKNIYCEFENIESPMYSTFNNQLSISKIFDIFEGLIFRNKNEELCNIFKNSNDIIEFVQKNISKHIDEMKDHEDSNKFFNKLQAVISENGREILNEFINIYLFWLIVNRFHSVTNDFFGNFKYSTPIRPKHQRSMIPDGTTIFDIDEEGRNLPMFLSALSTEQREKFSKWVNENFGYNVSIEEKYDNLTIYADFGDLKLNVVDTGVGISQLLPVQAKIWWAKYRPLNIRDNEVQGRTIAIEQPELYLHPRQQAALANAVTSIVTGEEVEGIPNPRFIIETHSEKLVSRFARFVRENKIPHKCIQVVRFRADPSNPIETDVILSDFTEDGKLKNWKYGFFNSGPPRG